jgi:CubicO group peptidase (beta-lactamase class C family)
MHTMLKRTLQGFGIAALVAMLIAGSAAVGGQTAVTVTEADVDRIFDRWTETTPGCAVGVSVNGRPTLAKAYGLADLERDVRNGADTIFEAGSVSKQFTAAAVLLLVKDGKLSLDDQVRKYIPELPDYGVPLTIRHMLNHASGLRDWGSVAGIGGWPRTTRAYTHAHVLEIVSRQRGLNFTPGTKYSYSNTGYNLSAILVARVSGMPFAEFTQKRIFGPLAMTRTSWRDDHQRIVKGRALAYSGDNGQFETLMPFENVHGNGGLLTTVGDLLKWNENFTSHVVGDAPFVREQETPGRFNDGRAQGYALGLMVGTHHGLREIAHSGSTAGYRAHLTRFPDQRLSVAVLCNVSSGNATQYAEAVADLYLAPQMKRATPARATHTLTAAEAAAATGMFRDTVTGNAVTVTRVDDGVRPGRGPVFVPTSGTRFVTTEGNRWEIDSRGLAKSTDIYGTVVTYERVPQAAPTASELQELTGTYVSDDAETALGVAVDNGALVVQRRPDAVIRLTPLYRDAFNGSIGTVIFRRNSAGRVAELSVVQDRVWDIRFARREAAQSTTQRERP